MVAHKRARAPEPKAERPEARAKTSPAKRTAAKPKGQPKPSPKAKPKTQPAKAKTKTARSKPRKRDAAQLLVSGASPPASLNAFDQKIESTGTAKLTVRRMHRRDINRVWAFLKESFRDVNRETVEYQRPRSKERFVESYDDEGVEQLIFEAGDDVVGYAECAFEVTGSDNWINPRYFGARDMRPLFVEELATHPDYTGRGVGSFMIEQLDHLARLRGCTHLVLEVAENNETALAFYRRRAFYKLDAAVFMAKKVEREPDLLPPRELGPAPSEDAAGKPEG